MSFKAAGLLYRTSVCALLACCIILSLSTTCLAQAAADPDVGTVVVDTPMFWLKDTNREPIRMLAHGTPVSVLGREGRWYKVVYHDARYGDDAGYIEVQNVRLDG